MGKLHGILQFTGKLDGLSFYAMNGKIIVRKTGGFDGKKIKYAANFERVRENGREFGHCAALGRYFRNSLHPYLKSLQIPYVHNRVLCLFQAICRLDLLHERGQRTVFQGLQSPEANAIIAAFEFDKNRSFSTIFPFRYTVTMAEGSLVISNFSSSLLQKVAGATHVRLRLLWIGLDVEHPHRFEQSSSDLMVIALYDTVETDVTLHSNVPTWPIVFGLLHFDFIQRLGDVDYTLQTGGMKIVGVWQGDS